ncbi:ABC transporter ATP-binding protein [Blautia marasmi]|uniref:ABC transporter ATP-binding protein n=1 Tax=Blautia marasmi TaxID=1917868 RepID=UPI000CF1EAFC|nr:ABC transporter ATP-binding protein [Blautia marasmi]
MIEKQKLLEIKNLNVEYHSDGKVAHAVNGIDFTLNKGETLGLVGETGAGKTTTALSILKLLPNMGRVSHMSADCMAFRNIDLLHTSEVEMRAVRGAFISMIFQDPMTSLNPVMSVGEQIAEVIRTHNPKFSKEEVDKEVERMLKMVGIPPERKVEYPHEFSGGMKQRIVIAIALSCTPALLIADEPTTALDVTIQAQVLDMMKDLKDKLDTAMLLITHDLGVVAETCDNVAVIYAGEIIEIGTAEDIFEGKFHHPYTIGLFGSIPDIKTETERLSPIPGLMPNPFHLPSGCKFHPRCPHCTEKCKTESPKVQEYNGHQIRCHYPVKEEGKGAVL